MAASATESISKLEGFDLWRNRLNSAKLVVAPMVDQSEAAWRMLSRKYGAELCYTPMFHASVFAKDTKYRKECLTTYAEDKPLIIQFCANDPEKLLYAAKQCEGKFDALDINLGCPQSIAKRGHYGAFLMEEWDLISQLVTVVHKQSQIPVTCKIRVFEDTQKTISYAKMLEAAGCQLLTVHGRTRDMKGPLTGLADWSVIRDIREAVNIPVFANGNIQYLSDVHRCIEQTGVHGVMSAEGNLHNPALFCGQQPPVWRVAAEYLQLARRYPCPLSYARGHVFKLLHYCLQLPRNQDAREMVARAGRLDDLEQAVGLLERRYSQYTQEGAPAWTPAPGEEMVAKLPLPPFLCQPHEREPIQQHLQKMEANAEKQRRERDARQTAAGGPEPEPQLKRLRKEDATVLSKRQLKKMAKGVKVGANRVTMERCTLCCNPKGQKCDYLLCRVHCRKNCYEQNLDCPGHRILCKTKRLKAKEYYATQNGGKEDEDVTQKSAVAEQHGEHVGREDVAARLGSTAVEESGANTNCHVQCVSDEPNMSGESAGGGRPTAAAMPADRDQTDGATASDS